MKLTLFDAGYCRHPEHIVMRGGRWSSIEFPSLFALLEHPKYGRLLFDTGYSTQFLRETRSFPNRLYAMLTPVTLTDEDLAINKLAHIGIAPTDIDWIFISHFHADHVSALGDFPRARFRYLPQAWQSVRGLKGLGALAQAHLPGLIPADFEKRSHPFLPTDVGPLPSEFWPFTQGVDVFGDGSLYAVSLPGHAEGQMGLIAITAEGIYFLVADAAWLSQSYQQNQPPHPITNLLFPDPGAYRQTLHDIHTMHTQRPDLHIIPSHCATARDRYAR